MSQAFNVFPWIHPRASEELITFFNKRGRWLRLRAGQSIFNGGDFGEVALILSGLGAYSYSDISGEPRIFGLIFSGCLMGNIDGMTRQVVNVIDYAVRDTEVRYVSSSAFCEYLEAHPKIATKHTLTIVHDHESDLEGAFANYTLSLPERLQVLCRSLYEAGSQRKEFHHDAIAEDGRIYAPLPYRFTTVEFARIVAARRPSVSSILNEWKRNGTILVRDGRMYVEKVFLNSIHSWHENGSNPGVHIRKSRKKVNSSSS